MGIKFLFARYIDKIKIINISITFGSSFLDSLILMFNYSITPMYKFVINNVSIMFNYSFANSIKLIYFVVLYYTRSIYYISTINIIIEIILMLLMSTLLPLKNYETELLMYIWLLSMSLQKIIIKGESAWRRIIYQILIVVVSGYWVVMGRVEG